MLKRTSCYSGLLRVEAQMFRIGARPILQRENKYNVHRGRNIEGFRRGSGTVCVPGRPIRGLGAGAKEPE